MQQLNAQEESLEIRGEHLFEIFDTSSPEASEIERQISGLTEGRHLYKPTTYRARYHALIDALRPFKTREMRVTNLVPLVGRALIAQRIAGTLTYTGTINYGALGSGSTAPASGDVKLGTEVFRKVPAVQSVSSNVASIQFFFTKADTNGTYQEWGTFIDGTASADSGQMFSHLLTGGWVKSASETMTVLSTYTIS
jgi:hypothetical protein